MCIYSNVDFDTNLYEINDFIILVCDRAVINRNADIISVPYKSVNTEATFIADRWTHYVNETWVLTRKIAATRSACSILFIGSTFQRRALIFFDTIPICIAKETSLAYAFWQAYHRANNSHHARIRTCCFAGVNGSTFSKFFIFATLWNTTLLPSLWNYFLYFIFFNHETYNYFTNIAKYSPQINISKDFSFLV